MYLSVIIMKQYFQRIIVFTPMCQCHMDRRLRTMNYANLCTTFTLLKYTLSPK